MGESTPSPAACAVRCVRTENVEFTEFFAKKNRIFLTAATVALSNATIQRIFS